MDVLDKFFTKYSYKFPKGYPDLKDKQDILLMESILEELGVRVRMNEGSLTPSDLKKSFFTKPEEDIYKNRGEKFIKKIEKGEDFQLLDGGKIEIDKEASIETIENFKKGSYKGNFIGTDGEEYGLKDFEKTSEFGGKINTTAITESAQAIAIALAFNVIKDRKLTLDDITKENFLEVLDSKDVMVGDKSPEVKDIIAYLDDPSKVSRDWKQSIIDIANKIKYNNPYVNPGKYYTAHWQDKLVDRIYDSWNLVKGKEGLKMQSDKWNPGDIWLSSPLGKKIPSIGGGNEDINFLNGVMNTLFCDQDLIAISLKKTKGEPKIKEFNTKTCSLPTNISYEGYKPLQAGAEIYFKSGDKIETLSLRNFDRAKGFSTEIKGKTAQGGKAGITPLNFIFKKYGLPSDYSLPPKSEEVEEAFKSNKEDNKYYEKFKTLYQSFIEEVGDDEFDKIMSEKDLKWKTSNFYALSVIHALENAEEKDKITKDIIRYAASATEFSSPFLKVSEVKI